MRIVADDKIPFLRGVLEPYAEVVYLPGAKITAQDVREADALIVRTRTRCDRALLQGSNVKLVATATIGFDHIQGGELDALGIEWHNAPGCNADSVKNYIASALVNLPFPLRGKTLGIIGVGHVGSRVADVGRALGMRVLLNDPPRAEAEGPEQFVSLEQLLAQSDVLTLHVPLVRDGKYPTVGLAGRDFFAACRPGAVFFNSCRGEAVDQEAFIAARKSGKISFALMDVWPGEPDLAPELTACVDLGTPHIAGYSLDGKANGTAASVRQVARFFGLTELQDWCPAELPPPRFPERIGLDTALPEDEQVKQAILHVYDIREDDRALRAAPEKFEFLRGAYPVRREFSAYTVYRASVSVEKRLKLLGFREFSK